VFTKSLSVTNPNANKSLVRFSNKERAYKPFSVSETLVFHFEMEG
jgi:hypothetical protein